MACLTGQINEIGSPIPSRLSERQTELQEILDLAQRSDQNLMKNQRDVFYTTGTKAVEKQSGIYPQKLDRRYPISEALITVIF
jgi:hypothetical protein